MKKLFETSQIGGMNLANRFVRSATWEGLATAEGGVTPRLIERMTRLARGGVGLIISSHTYVRPEGQATPWQLGIYKDELIPGLSEMAGAVHKNRGRIVLQLAHAGAFAAESVIDRLPLAVSNYEGLADSPRKQISRQDIEELVGAFADGARRAKAAGFDGVELHAAHGYLLSQFFSPLYNRRRDEYGGSVENRARVCLEILSAIRETVGRDYPVLIKMNGQDYSRGGLVREESVQIAQLLAEVGIDAVEVSGGLLKSIKTSPSRPRIDQVEKEVYFREDARLFKKVLTIPLILVGGIRSFEVAEQLVADGEADYISMSRPLIREPELVSRWQAGDRRRAECTSDNLCFAPGFKGEGVYCVSREKETTQIS
ncbi:2,4-dienoyl-CoA reductase [Syntrophus gentianae]|uniref:2,4-dienoyl-CoA reductase n=1 Tax=Syntrophus gentianae TaxID=43775 RepID=A0A1H7ZR19_9BACT|nr:NADH:flavin oxidoreductase [Syntrophus gentianae]SEM60716.1 2,4-dienoyl-CoA reductase [Syntrophus gentianae]